MLRLKLTVCFGFRVGISAGSWQRPTVVVFVCLSSTVHLLRLLGHHHLTNALVSKSLENLVMASTSYCLEACFIFGKAFNFLGRAQQFETGPRVACGCVPRAGREAALWTSDPAVCFRLH